MTPFGSAVVPEVYTIIATSSSWTSTCVGEHTPLNAAARGRKPEVRGDSGRAYQRVTPMVASSHTGARRRTRQTLAHAGTHWHTAQNKQQAATHYKNFSEKICFNKVRRQPFRARFIHHSDLTARVQHAVHQLLLKLLRIVRTHVINWCLPYLGSPPRVQQHGNGAYCRDGNQRNHELGQVPHPNSNPVVTIRVLYTR